MHIYNVVFAMDRGPMDPDQLNFFILIVIKLKDAT